MSENKNDSIKRIDDLVVYAMGQFPVEISRRKQVSSTNRVKLKASVDSTTGEVSFYIDKEDIKKLEK